MKDETTRNDRVLAAVRAAVEMANVSDDDVAEFRERWLRPHMQELVSVTTFVTIEVDGRPLYATALAIGQSVASTVQPFAQPPLRFEIAAKENGITVNIKERT